MAARQTRRQLQFTGFEMAMIGVSFLVTMTAVFFLGLFVGKKNAFFHVPPEDRVARVPVDDFTRYKRPEPIKAPPKAAAVAAGEAAPAAAKVSPAAAADAGKAAPPVDGGAAASVAAPVSKEEGKPGSAAALESASAPVAAPRDAALAAKEAAAKAAAAKEAAAKAAADKQKEKDKEEPATGRGYTVQILATRKQADADALAAKLKSKGLAAYIKRVSEGEGAWFRVRVGSYGTFSDARGMADRCHRELGLGQAFVSTE